MSNRSSRLASIVVPAAMALAAGCGNDIEGRYYNAETGQFALELKNGKATGQGMGDGELTYRVSGDTVLIEGGGIITDGLYFIRKANGDLDFAGLGTLTKNRPD